MSLHELFRESHMPEMLLEKMREQAGLTQEQLGKRLEISQVQVSRYESNPNSIPVELYWKWRRACGIEGGETVGLDAGKPYVNLIRDLNVLKEFIPESASAGLPTDAPSPAEFRQRLTSLQRKPIVTIAGQFDAGKTRLANELLGGDFLPHGYQPHTSIIAFIRHLEEKPAWFKESVWVMGSKFEPDKWDDQKHCIDNRIVAGELDTLRKYGVRDEEAPPSEAHSALVFLDSSILHSCTLVDLPGNLANKEDTEKAASATAFTDILLYASPIRQFINSADYILLGEFLRRLPAHELVDKDFPPLGNFFFVGSHADQNISDKQVLEVKAKAASRVHKHFKDTIWKDRAEKTGADIDAKLLESRIVTFWAETPERRKDLESRLVDLLGVLHPRVRRKQVDQDVRTFREVAGSFFEPRIKEYNALITSEKNADAAYRKLESGDPKRQEEVAKRRAEVHDAIHRFKEEGVRHFSKFYDSVLAIDYLKSLLDRHYKDNKEEAQQHAPALVFEIIRSRYDHLLREQSAELKPLLESVVGEYQKVASRVVEMNSGVINVPFDAKGAFAAGLSAVGTIGALSAWAASLGNLGGYIIAAKLASALSAVGISFSGGAATVVGAISMLGGPIVVAIAIAATIGAIIGKVFGESWQSRLAKKLNEEFSNSNLKATFAQAIKDYWSDTQAAFVEASNSIESRWSEELNKFRALVAKPQETRVEIEKLVAKYEEILKLVRSLPWKSILG